MASAVMSSETDELRFRWDPELITVDEDYTGGDNEFTGKIEKVTVALN
jgi:hypothetical protein